MCAAYFVTIPASRACRGPAVQSCFSQDSRPRAGHRFQTAYAKSYDSAVPALPRDGSLDDRDLAAAHELHHSESLPRSVQVIEADEPVASSSDTVVVTAGAPRKPDLKVVGSVVSVLGLALLIAGGFYYSDSIRAFLVYFTTVVDDWGPWGVVAYFGLYTALEVLAVPAIPLTMTAGAIFGIIPGTLITSLAGTLAATISFLVARYLARDKFKAWAVKRKEFRAVDKAIGENGLKVVTLLRLSPLLPLAASNYLYGLTSVKLPAYVLGSWIGMTPGTLAYVSAGHVSKVALLEGGDLPLQWWQVALAVGVSVIAIGYIGSLAKKALKEVDEEVVEVTEAASDSKL